MNELKTVEKIIFHCSDTDRDTTKPESITSYHVNKLKWDACGYHYMIDAKGSIHLGRPDTFMGAHCKGQNHCSIGVCWLGKGDLTEAQRKAGKFIVDMIRFRHGAKITVHGHNEFSSKTCPNTSVDFLKIDLKV